MILLSSSFESAMQLVGAFLIFGVILVITHFTTKWVGGYQKLQMRNKNLQVIESLNVAPNKYVCLIKTGEVYLVVAVGKDEVTLLTQLTEEQLSEVPVFDSIQGNTMSGKTVVAENFREVMEIVKGQFPKK